MSIFRRNGASAFSQFDTSFHPIMQTCETTRRAMVWYYSTLSMVNLIYGSFATSIVARLIAEAVTLILLLGAQVIAELESKTNESSKEKTTAFKT